MKVIKIILSVLAIFFGGIISLYSFIKLFYCFDGLTKASGPEELGFYIGYLISTVLIGSLFVWIFWKGISFFTKKKELKTKEIEKKINDVDI